MIEKSHKVAKLLQSFDCERNLVYLSFILHFSIIMVKQG